MRRLIAVVALALLIGVIFGGTVLRNDIAEARALAQSVLVSNTSAQAVPVAVVARANATTFQNGLSIGDSSGGSRDFDLPRMDMSFISLLLSGAVNTVSFRYHTSATDTQASLVLHGPAGVGGIEGSSHFTLPLTQPVPVDQIRLVCNAPCFAVIGRSGTPS